MIENLSKINLNEIKQNSSKEKKKIEKRLYLHISYHKVYTYSVACYYQVDFLRLFVTKGKSFLLIHKGLL